MRTVLCGFAVGVWYVQQRAELPSAVGFIACFALIFLASSAAMSLYISRKTLSSWICQHRPLFSMAASKRLLSFSTLGCALIAALAIGYGFAAWRAKIRLAHTLPTWLERRDIQITGWVVGLPTLSAYRTRFTFEIQKSDLPSVPRWVQLSWYTSPNMPRVRLHTGERWHLTVRLTRVHGHANYHGADFEASMFERNLRATGYVRAQPAPILLARHTRGLKLTLDRWRNAVGHRIAAVLADAPHTGVMTALAIGLQSAISADDRTIFTRTGTNHLVAISGLHISLVAGFAAALFGWLWRHSGFIGQHWPLKIAAQRVAACAGVCAGSAYALLAGFGVPAQRALVMLIVVGAALISAREVGTSITLSWALAVVLLIDPWAVNSAGFWLSFSAVAVILMVVTVTGTGSGSGKNHAPLPSPASDNFIKRRWCQISSALSTAIRIQGAVTLSLMPLSALWFAQVSLVSPFANLIAIPWVSFLVTPLVLVGVILPAPLDALAFHSAHALFSILAAGLHILAAPSWALQSVHAPDRLALVLAILGAVCWIAPLRKRPPSAAQRSQSRRALTTGDDDSRQIALIGFQRMAALLLFMPLFFARARSPAIGEFKITVLDVGQGAATLVETAHHRLLFDAGPRYDAISDAGQRVILPYLHAEGIHRLDMLVISHADSDHVGGAHTVLAAVPTTQLRASLPATHPLWRTAWSQHMSTSFGFSVGIGIGTGQGIHDIARCHAGESWQWEGVRFTMLWPDVPAARGVHNAGSCVLRLDNGRQTALLTGDIGASEERQLIAQNNTAALLATVLIAPHHGSRTSSSERFLDAIAPREAVFQVGYRNRFHHPNPQVIARYQAHHINIHRSDRDGAVIFETKGKKLVVERYREVKKRYWMGQ